jgi:flagellar L-ring protein FlgH
MKTKFLLAAGLSLTISGCAVERRFFPKPSADDMSREVERLRDTNVSTHAVTRSAPGSLWPADDHVFLYRDRKAFRVGDILTVSIVENAQASNTADTDLSRSSSIKANFNTFFGNKKFLNLFKLGDNLIDSSSENAHTGSGTTSREGMLSATMTTVVKEVLPNGNLVIQGNRVVVVNHEEQYITLTGIVRPEDIRRDNVVLSSHLADANITFGGTGVVADKQRSGWGTWLFDFVWPF